MGGNCRTKHLQIHCFALCWELGELPQHCYGIPETSVSLLGTHLGLELLEEASLSLSRANGREECDQWSERTAGQSED